jgi:hypothetical protein
MRHAGAIGSKPIKPIEATAAIEKQTIAVRDGATGTATVCSDFTVPFHAPGFSASISPTD